MKSEFLANVIWVLHMLFVLWVVVVPFTDNEPMLVLHLMVIPSLWTHWILNQDTCMLTITERYFRGCDSKESFFHNLVSPVYKIGDSAVQQAAWIASGILWSITLYKVMKRPQMIKDVFLLRQPPPQKS